MSRWRALSNKEDWVFWSASFYRLPANTSREACIYFVIDNAAQLLLYIGETCRSNLRW